MARHASAQKAARQAIKHALRNESELSACKTAMRKVRSAATAVKNKEEAKKTLPTLLNEAQSVLMSTAKKGIMKKDTASRYVSRLSIAVHKALA